MKNSKKVLITGGAQRIGCSITKHLASKGYDVAIQYNTSKSDVNKLISLFKSSCVNFRAFQFDFKKAENYEDFFEKIKKEFGDIDILINNASAFEFDSIKQTSYEIFDNHININLRAPFFLSKSYVENYKKKETVEIFEIMENKSKESIPKSLKLFVSSNFFLSKLSVLSKIIFSIFFIIFF